MDEYILSDPCRFNHHQLFRLLQRESLYYRLNDSYCSLGWFSPGQVFVLDEYCARYGVRTCFRHLSYLCDLLEFAEKGTLIDPTLIHYSFAFCSSHVHGNRYLHFSMTVQIVGRTVIRLLPQCISLTISDFPV